MKKPFALVVAILTVSLSFPGGGGRAFAVEIGKAGPVASASGLVPPQSVGISPERLQRIPKTMQRYIDEGHIAGTVAYVMRRGKLVLLEANGMADIEHKI